MTTPIRSSFMGVSWHKTNKKWLAQLCVQSKNYCIGYFTSEEEAARAYDAKKRELRGQGITWKVGFNVNFPLDGEKQAKKRKPAKKKVSLAPLVTPGHSFSIAEIKLILGDKSVTGKERKHFKKKLKKLIKREKKATEPVKHETPAEPVKHETPAEPVKHETPAEPVKHETPAEPVKHETPAEPVKHETPAEPGACETCDGDACGACETG